MEPIQGDKLRGHLETLILATLEHFEGDKQKVADVLQISVKTVYNRLREYKTG